MSARASRSCSTCGHSVPEGALACPHDGTLVPDALVGQHLGEYVVRRHIGSGGMGIVYEGEHLTIGRKVAIKLLRQELSQGAQARGLLAEARAASAIRHRGIIDIFGFGQQPGIGQYLVMEYLEGSPLDELIQARAPLPLAEAIALLGEVLDALSAAHAVGVIHRDLKPSNIFVARQSNGTESIKVLDFGLAKRSTTPQGTAAADALGRHRRHAPVHGSGAGPLRRRWAPRRTCTRWASSPSRCSPGGGPSPAARPWRSSPTT